jgi:hypothetical protein
MFLGCCLVVIYTDKYFWNWLWKESGFIDKGFLYTEVKYIWLSDFITLLKTHISLTTVFLVKWNSQSVQKKSHFMYIKLFIRTHILLCQGTKEVYCTLCHCSLYLPLFVCNLLNKVKRTFYFLGFNHSQPNEFCNIVKLS